MLERKTREPLPKTRLKGSLHLAWKRCGKPTCRCRWGDLHGPYYTLRWRDAGRQRKTYIPACEVPSVLLGIEARRQTAQERQQLKRSLHRRRKDSA